MTESWLFFMRNVRISTKILEKNKGEKLDIFVKTEYFS